MARLGELCNIVNGYAFQSEKYTDHGVRIIRIANVQKGYIEDNTPQFYPEEEMIQLQKYMLYEGDLLLSLTGNVGRVAFLTKELLPAALNQRVACLRIIDKEKLDIHYLFHLLNSDRFENLCIASSKGVAQKNMSTEWLKEYEFELPSIQEQRLLSKLFDKVESIIALRKKQLQKLDDLVKARFVEMFGDPVTNPLGWEQVTLKDVAKGKLSYGSGVSATDFDGNLRYVRITDITENGDLNNDRKSPDQFDEKYLLHDGDILFARSGATVGKTFCYAERKHGRAIYAGYLIRMIPDTSKVLPTYVFYYTKTEYYASFVANAQRAVAQPNINAQEYGDLIICVPPMELQQQFAVFVSQVDKSKLSIQQSLDKLETLKQSLMQQYFG